MKILHVLNSPALGGTESWVLNFVHASPDTVRNELVLFGADGPLASEMAPHVAGIVRRGARPLRTRDLIRICGERGADQIWLHSDLARAYGAFLRGRRHPMCVAVCHSSWGASTVLARVGGVGRRGAWDGVITVGERLFGDLPEAAAVGRVAALVPPPRNVAGTPRDGVTPPDPTDDGRRALVYVARLVDGKGHETLLGALALLVQRHPATRLVLVGEGPMRGSLADAATRLGVAEHVTFAGGVVDIGPHLAFADVFVHPSESEGFSVSGLEAALAGLPIVARDLPCHDEYLRPGHNGLAFAESPVELARCIGEVLDDLPTFVAGAADVRSSLGDDLRKRFAEGLAEVVAWT